MNRLLLCATLLLAGCGGVAPKIVEKPILVDRPELIVPEIQPVQQYDFEWIVVTRENFDTVARELESRKAAGMAASLTAKDNSDLADMWKTTIAILTNESLEFSDFYNRFLQNDPITLG